MIYNILKAIAVFMVVLFLLSACAVDSESNLPLILVCISEAYLWFFACFNDKYKNQ